MARARRYCERGDLGRYLNEMRAEGKKGLDERRVLRWTRQMGDALHYLHGKRILHRDMKPLNVLLTTEGVAKLGDFGLASSSKKDKATSQVGTPCYLSPEVLQNDEYGSAVDVWGCGCVAYEMMTFDFLWERKGMISVQVLSRPFTAHELPAHFSDGLRALVAAMLDKACTPPAPRPPRLPRPPRAQQPQPCARSGAARGLRGLRGR